MSLLFKNTHQLEVFLLSLLATALFLGSFIVTAVPAYAQGMSSMPGMGGVRSMKLTPNMSPITRFMEVDNDALFTPMDVTLDILGVIIMLIAIITISNSVREYGKSNLGVAILYLLNATLVLGAIRLIFILDDDNILNVKDVAEMTAWHTLFYYAIILFYIGGLTFTKLVSTQNGKSSYSRAIFMLIFSILFSAVILISYSQSFVQDFLVKYEQPLWFYTFGWWHIIAVILSACIAIYLFKVRNKFKGYSAVIGSIIIAILLTATIHLWELLNEAWQVIIVSDNFGEFFERVLWIPVFIFILYSFIKLRRISITASNAAPVPSVQSTDTPSTPPQPPGIQPLQMPQPPVTGQNQQQSTAVPAQQETPVPLQQPAPVIDTPQSVSVNTESTTPLIGSEDTDTHTT